MPFAAPSPDPPSDRPQAAPRREGKLRALRGALFGVRVPRDRWSVPLAAPPFCVACNAPDPTSSVTIFVWLPNMPGATLTSRVSVRWGCCPGCRTAVRLGGLFATIQAGVALTPALFLTLWIAPRAPHWVQAVIVLAIAGVIGAFLTRYYVAPVTFGEEPRFVRYGIAFTFRHPAYAAAFCELNGLESPFDRPPTADPRTPPPSA